MRSQKTCELFPFVGLLHQLGCQSFLEVGSREGETLLAIGCTMTRVVSVEFPDGPWGNSKSLVELRNNVQVLQDHCNVDTTLILGDSADGNVIEKVSELGPFDAVFVDADHRYESVKRDWENYGPLARKVVAFHDIAGSGVVCRKSNSRVGVPLLWSEIKNDHNVQEFVERWSPRPMGIGAILIQQCSPR